MIEFKHPPGRGLGLYPGLFLVSGDVIIAVAAALGYGMLTVKDTVSIPWPKAAATAIITSPAIRKPPEHEAKPLPGGCLNPILYEKSQKAAAFPQLLPGSYSMFHAPNSSFALR